MNNETNTNSWSVKIDKLMIWRTGWIKYEHKTSNYFILRVVYDQLLILSDKKVLESFNMKQKMKGIYKDDILILIIKSINNDIKRIKFQIKSNTSQCLEALAQHFPVISHDGLPSNKTLDCKFRNIDELMKHALAYKDQTSSVSLPNEFENFFKLCLLDPSFPQMIAETEKILNKTILKK